MWRIGTVSSDVIMMSLSSAEREWLDQEVEKVLQWKKNMVALEKVSEHFLGFPGVLRTNK